MSSSRLQTLFRVLLAVFVVWSLVFIYRTSFRAEESRIFCLWDDAMVSMRFARNLATGHGFVWNAGAERLQGYSNLGITLLMVLIHLLPIGITKTSLVFQLFNVGLLAYCAILVRDLCARLFESELAGLTAAFVFMLCGPIAVLTLLGTDVGVITTVLLAALRIVVTEIKKGSPFPARIYPILALGILTRLDFASIYVVFAVASLAFPRSRASLQAAVGVFVLTLGGILGFQYGYYGDPLPNTYYLKATGSPILLMLASGLDHQVDLMTRGFVTLTIAALVLVGLHRKDRLFWLLGAIPLALIAYDIRYGGDWTFRYASRFSAPAYPVLIICVVGASYQLFERLALVGPKAGEDAPAERLRPSQRTWGFLLFSLVSITTFNSAPALKEWLDPFEEIPLASINIKNYRLARYFQRHTSPDATVAVNMAGTLPYFLDRYTLDVLGKCDSHIARMVVPRFIAGHSKWDWDYMVNTRRPDILDHTSRGLVVRPDFIELYSQAEVTGFAPFYVRKESLAKLLDPTARFTVPKRTVGVAPEDLLIPGNL